MKKTTPPIRILLSAFFLLQIFFTGNIVSQNYTEEFKLVYPKKIISNGNYNAINFLDSRLEKDDFGYVYSGPDNKKVPVVQKPDLNTQFNSFLKNSIDSSTADGELLIQLRKFKFLVKPESANELGFCLFRADLYIRQDSTYKKLTRIDTIIVVEAPEATKPLFDAASNAITTFILKNLDRGFSNTQDYTYRQLTKIDSIEKSKIRLYSTSPLTNGVYKNFQSFKDQTPDFRLIDLVHKKEKLSAINALNFKGKKMKLKPDEFFAFVSDGKPFISAEFDCHPIEKIDTDLYFTGEGKVAAERSVRSDSENGPSVKSVEKAAAIPQTAFYLIRIDHIDGSLMRIKEIKK